MDGSEPGRELDVDSGFGEHFAEKYEAKPVISNHSNNESRSNRDIIDLSRCMNQRHQVLKENNSKNNIHYVIENQNHNKQVHNYWSLALIVFQ
jgi:hypothetical protein